MGAHDIQLSMSYASVTARNAAPIDDQPHPDQGLLNTIPPHHSGIADDAAKVNIVAPDFKEHPHTLTSEAEILVDDVSSDLEAEPHKSRRHKKHHNAEPDAFAHAVDVFKHYLIRPGVAGGLIGLGMIFHSAPKQRANCNI